MEMDTYIIGKLLFLYELECIVRFHYFSDNSSFIFCGIIY